MIEFGSFRAADGPQQTRRYTAIISVNPLKAKLNSICHFLAFLGAHHIFHVSGVRVKNETFLGIIIIIIVVAAAAAAIATATTTTT